MADLNVSLIIRAIDRASAPVRRINQSLRGLTRTGPERDALGRFVKQNTLFGQLGTSALATGAAFGKAATEAGKLAKRVALFGGLGGFLFKREFIDTAAEFEGFRAQLESLQGSSEGAKQAMDWVTQFATKTPTDVAGVMEAFVRMRAFGLDPMNGSMMAIVDQTSKLGFSQDKMMGIVTALGQAWTKQKLQGEEALQLIERGVPVWDLLASASGRSAVQIQKMSSAGALGRRAIQALITEMGKQSQGAAEKQMQTYAGLVSNLSDEWTQFKLTVMGAGVFDIIKNGLKGAIDWIQRMKSTGKLEQWAREAAVALKSAGHAAFELGGWVKNTLIPAIQRAVELVGGWRNALIAVALVISAKTIIAVGQFAMSLGPLITDIALLTFRLSVGLVSALARASTMIIVRGIPALISLASATWTALAPVLVAAAPFLAVAAAIGAVVLAVRQLIKYWEQLDFGGALKGMALTFAEDGAFGTLARMFDPRSLINSVSEDLGGGTIFGSGPAREPLDPKEIASSQRQQFDGSLNIKIDSEGRPRVAGMQSRGPVDLDVDTGLAMVTS